MNTKNLQLIADHIKTVPQEEFDMSDVYKCVIGHTCRKFYNDILNTIYFPRWFNQYIDSDDSSKARAYIVSSLWKNKDNTPEGAAKRIEHVIQWLDSPSRDKDYFLNILKETFPGYYNL